MSNMISIIINTDGRAASLKCVVDALVLQSFSAFELCIVYGPTDDGTAQFAQELATNGIAKVAACPVRNLSVSRNLGLDLAAGDLVAFIDDDAIPEPIWLEQLAKAFENPDVAGSNGLVFHPDGRRTQFRYSTCDRFGETRHEEEPDYSGAYPMSASFPHVMGCNCIFRREALLGIGGFDEEYEYYLEEADVCCSLIDAGHKIEHVSWAPVHHKYLSGGTRNASGITVNRGAIVKNQLYFSLQNARGHASLLEIIEKSRKFANWHRQDLEQEVVKGTLHQTVLDTFDADIEIALERAFVEGLSQPKKTREAFPKPPAFLPFPAKPRNSHVAIIADSLPTAIERIENTASTFFRIFVPSSAAPSLEGVNLANEHLEHFVSPHGELQIPTSREATSAEINVALERAMERVERYHSFDRIINLRGG